MSASTEQQTAHDMERMDVVVAGHVDHGKSTVIGRLMADTGSLPEGKLDQVKATCARNARPFEYAFLLDALKNEQAQGITIDTARCFFKTDRRHYILHDAPGHVEFLKNMITGASRAQAALLVIDGDEGVKENSKRHGYILSMLGIRQIAVLVNKMDLLSWDEAAFDEVVGEYSAFLDRLGVKPTRFIPVSAREGSNIVHRGGGEWYDGPTVLEQVELFSRVNDDLARPFRMPLQGVYKFTAEGDDRRIFAGTIETGCIAPGDDIRFLPSGKHSRVASIEVLDGPSPTEAHAGQATGFTLDTQVYVKPGELVVRQGEPEPAVTRRFRANVFWMGLAALVKGRRYVLRLGTAKVPVELEEVLSVLDAEDLSSASGAAQVERHAVAEVVLRSLRPVAMDVAGALEPTSRFVIVSGYDIAGCGIVLEPLSSDKRSDAQDQQFTAGLVTDAERARRNGHGGKVVLVLGDGVRSTSCAALIERRLFDERVQSYFLGATDAIAVEDVLVRDERLATVGRTGRAMAEAGVVLVVALGAVDRFDVDRVRGALGAHAPYVIALGEGLDEDEADLVVATHGTEDEWVSHVLRGLASSGVLPDYQV